MAGHDATLEVADDLLQDAIKNHDFICTSDIEKIRNCNFYIVAVPTPVDDDNNPDLTPLVSASTTVGKVISKGDVVVYESTVYPGVTEDECIPVVEKVSGMKMNVDFYGGYSPERINPGDKQHTVEHIKKVAYIMISLIILPNVGGAIFEIILNQDLNVSFELFNVIEVLIIFVIAYIFEYGYEIQLDSKGRMYGEDE